jgi:protein-disulfide isomerase
MRRFIGILGLAGLLVLAAPVLAAPAPAPTPATEIAPLPDRVLGKPDAPVKVDEYVSLTCPHCAEFYNDTLPALETNYVDTGKARFVFHNFVLDGVGLKAAQIARCMPEQQFFPFVKMLYKDQNAWAAQIDPAKVLISYAKLGGLPEDQAKACLADTKLQNAIIAERDEATQKYKIEATPTFILNDGEETIKGVAPYEQFAKLLDKLAAEKH